MEEVVPDTELVELHHGQEQRRFPVTPFWKCPNCQTVTKKLIRPYKIGGSLFVHGGATAYMPASPIQISLSFTGSVVQPDSTRTEDYSDK